MTERTFIRIYSRCTYISRNDKSRRHEQVNVNEANFADLTAFTVNKKASKRDNGSK